MYVVIGLQDHEGSVGGDSADHEHLEERTLQDLPEELLTFHVLPPVRGASERCGYRRQLDSRSTAPLLGVVFPTALKETYRGPATRGQNSLSPPSTQTPEKEQSPLLRPRKHYLHLLNKPFPGDYCQ